MLAAMQAQHAHFLEQQKGLEARMRLQEESFLQARAPTHVEIIRERVVPTTHVHPVVAQPDNAAEQRAQLAAALSGMHQTLSEHAARHAGDMRESMRGWLNDAHSIWNRPPPAPGAPEAPGVAASSGSPPPGPPPPPAAGAVASRGARLPAGLDAAARSAAAHATPEAPRRRERSRSPARAGESRDTVERAARGPAKTARVTKPKVIPPPKPRRYGPQLAPEPAPAPPPPPPPAPAPKKRKAPEEEASGAPAPPAPRPRAKARAKAMAASLPDHLRRAPDQERPEPPPKRQRVGFDPPPRKRTPKAKARGRTPFVIAAA